MYVYLLSIDVLVDDIISDQSIQFVIDEVARQTVRDSWNLTKIHHFEVVNVEKDGE